MTGYIEKNIRALKEYLPELAAWIQGTPDVPWVQIRGKQLHVKHGLQYRAAYDNDDPVKGTDSIAKQSLLYDQHASIIIGMGLGHSAWNALRAKEKKHLVVIIEPTAHLIRAAFERYDFTRWLKDRSLVICAPGQAEIAHVLTVIDAGRVIENWYMTAEPYTLWRNEYIPLMDFAGQMLNQMRCNTGTVMANGALIAANDIKCLPYVLKYRGVNELLDIFKGKPAIVVSTGPSLARNIHKLKELQERAVIVAVGQALRPLLAYGVRPDLICSVDFGPVNMAHYQGLMDCTVPLVTLNRAWYKILEQYKGMKFISAAVDPSHEGTVHGLLLDKGALVQGGSVAHMACGMAIQMGCDPIVFVGQDLALGDTSHIPLVDAMGNVKKNEAGNLEWEINDKRSGIADQKHSMGEAVNVPGYYGDTATTNTGLASFITAFESIFQQRPDRTFINATEGGARLDGARSMFLSKVADKYMGAPVDKGPLTRMLTYAANGEELVTKALPLMRDDIKLMRGIIEDCVKTLDTCIILKSKPNSHSKSRMVQALKENSFYGSRAQKNAKKSPAVTVAIYGAARTIGGRHFDSVKRTDPEYLLSPKGAKDLLARVERTEFIMEAAKAAATTLLESSEAALKLLESGPVEPTGETAGPDFSDAEEYISNGNFAHPLVDLELSGRHLEDADAMELYRRCKAMMQAATDKAEAQERVDLEQHRDTLAEVVYLVAQAHKHGGAGAYEGALKLLEEALGLMPEYEQALWGRASTLGLLKRHAEAIEVYDALLVKSPDKHSYIFERGVAMTRAGRVGEGIAEIRRAMTYTNAYDAFFKVLGEIHEKEGQIPEAVAAYEYYLEHVGGFDDALKARVAALKAA